MKIRIFTLMATTAAALAAVTVAVAQSSPAVPSVDPDGAFTGRQFGEPTGEKMFRRVCAACHMPDAKGAVGAGAYPALAGNKKLAVKAYPAYVVLHGLNGMPPIGNMMTDQQVADVVNHVRTQFGTKYTDVMTADEVKAMR